MGVGSNPHTVLCDSKRFSNRVNNRLEFPICKSEIKFFSGVNRQNSTRKIAALPIYIHNWPIVFVSQLCYDSSGFDRVRGKGLQISYPAPTYFQILINRQVLRHKINVSVYHILKPAPFCTNCNRLTALHRIMNLISETYGWTAVQIGAAPASSFWHYRAVFFKTFSNKQGCGSWKCVWSMGGMKY